MYVDRLMLAVGPVYGEATICVGNDCFGLRRSQSQLYFIGLEIRVTRPTVIIRTTTHPFLKLSNVENVRWGGG